MEKVRTITSRKYFIMSCYRFFIFKGHKDYEQSLILSINNNGGSISFLFSDLSTKEETNYIDPKSGDYIIPLHKGSKMKLVIKAKRAIGSYKIAKKTII